MGRHVLGCISSGAFLHFIGILALGSYILLDFHVIVLGISFLSILLIFVILNFLVHANYEVHFQFGIRHNQVVTAELGNLGWVICFFLQVAHCYWCSWRANCIRGLDQLSTCISVRTPFVIIGIRIIWILWCRMW